MEQTEPLQEQLKNQEIKEELKKDQEIAEKSSDQQEETPEQINWRKFREKREEERKAAERKIAEERERAEKAAAEAKALKEAIDAIISNQGQTSDEYQDESDSERVAKLVRQEIERREAEREKERAEREAREWPNRLVRDLPDFDKVCTAENLDYLEYHHPEIAEAVKDLPDGYSKWKRAYGLIKKYVPNNAESKKDEQRLERNMSKPRSASVPGLSTTGDLAPNMLNDSRKKDNWARMQKVLKGA